MDVQRKVRSSDIHYNASLKLCPEKQTWSGLFSCLSPRAKLKVQQKLYDFKKIANILFSYLRRILNQNFFLFSYVCVPVCGCVRSILKVKGKKSLKHLRKKPIKTIVQ